MEGQHGLEWVETTFSLEPRWTVDPKVSDIEATVQATFKTPQSYFSSSLPINNVGLPIIKCTIPRTPTKV